MPEKAYRKRKRSASVTEVTSEKPKFLRFLGKMLTKRSASFQILAKRRPKRNKKTTSGARDIHLLDLPNQIFNIVFENLDLPECMVLALICKDLALKLDHNGLLDWGGNRLLGSEIAYFTKKRLGEGFFPRELR